MNYKLKYRKPFSPGDLTICTHAYHDNGICIVIELESTNCYKVFSSTTGKMHIMHITWLELI